MLFDEPLNLTSVHPATQRPARGFVGGLARLVYGAAQLRLRVRRDVPGVELARGPVDAFAFRATGGELRARGGACDLERLVDLAVGDAVGVLERAVRGLGDEQRPDHAMGGADDGAVTRVKVHPARIAHFRRDADAVDGVAAAGDLPSAGPSGGGAVFADRLAEVVHRVLAGAKRAVVADAGELHRGTRRTAGGVAGVGEVRGGGGVVDTHERPVGFRERCGQIGERVGLGGGPAIRAAGADAGVAVADWHGDLGGRLRHAGDPVHAMRGGEHHALRARRGGDGAGRALRAGDGVELRGRVEPLTPRRGRLRGRVDGGDAEGGARGGERRLRGLCRECG